MLDQAEKLRAMMQQRNENKKDPKERTNNELNNELNKELTEGTTKEVEKNTKKAKIITITSGKGGVGKSNFVVNLGIAIQKMGKSVLIFDADIGMGNDDVLMGVYSKHNIFDIINLDMSIEDVLVEGPFGVKLLPGGSGLNRIEELDDKDRTLFLNKLKAINNVDYIIMDTGAGVNRSVLAFIACSEQLIVLTTPEPTSLTDAYSLLKATNHFNIKSEASIVINRAFDKEEGIQTFNKFNNAVNKFLDLKIKYLGCILEDRKLVESVRAQKPVLINFPNSYSCKCIEEIAIKLSGQNVNKKGAGVEEFFKKIFNIFS